MINESLRVTLREAQLEETTVVELHGDVDVATAHLLRDALAAVPLPRTIAVDMSDLQFIDSSGLSVLARFAERAQRDGGKVVVVGARPSVRRLFALTSLDRKLSIVDRIEA